jgi:hypothetical protein
MSPDQHFVVGLHPDHAQVAVAAGFSGHGFKFASVIGEILADLAIRQACRHDISLFALSRFGRPMSQLHRDKLNLIERGLPPEGGLTPSSSHAQPHGAAPHRIAEGGRWGYDDSTVPRYWRSENVRPFW